MFPPFPGDTIILIGAVLITGYGWNWIGISLAVLLGSLMGVMFDYWLGLRLGRRPRRPGREKRHAALDRVMARFERHRRLYLIINRFLPGIRPLFFVAAGLSRMSVREVLLYGGLSVVLYNGALVAAGAALGANLPALQTWVHRYTTLTWAVLLGAAAAYGLWRLWQWRRRGSPRRA